MDLQLVLRDSVAINFQDFLISGKLNEYQVKILEKASEILKLNTVGEIMKLGGNVEKNEDKLKEITQKFETELKKEKYGDQKKELKNFLKSYMKLLRQKISRTCMGKIPVKEMPIIDVHFSTLPYISLQDQKPQLFDDIIFYAGEIQCSLPRGIIYGRIKSVEPLFAPVMDNIEELTSGKEHPEQDAQYDLHSYLEQIANKLDSIEFKGFLLNFHENFERRGDPLCDYLNKNEDLLHSMNKLTTSTETHRKESDIAINAVIIPQSSRNKAMVLVTNESSEENRFEDCFEGLLKFSAICCQAVNNLNLDSQKEESSTIASQVVSDDNNVARTPGGQEINVWTQEELIEEASKRHENDPSSGMDVWTEEELSELSKQRGTGIPEDMEVWDKEALRKLAEERKKGGLNIPKWKQDETLKECSQCGYALQANWKICPICKKPVNETNPDS